MGWGQLNNWICYKSWEVGFRGQSTICIVLSVIWTADSCDLNKFFSPCIATPIVAVSRNTLSYYHMKLYLYSSLQLRWQKEWFKVHRIQNTHQRILQTHTVAFTLKKLYANSSPHSVPYGSAWLKILDWLLGYQYH